MHGMMMWTDSHGWFNLDWSGPPSRASWVAKYLLHFSYTVFSLRKYSFAYMSFCELFFCDCSSWHFSIFIQKFVFLFLTKRSMLCTKLKSIIHWFSLLFIDNSIDTIKVHDTLNLYWSISLMHFWLFSIIQSCSYSYFAWSHFFKPIHSYRNILLVRMSTPLICNKEQVIGSSYLA